MQWILIPFGWAFIIVMGLTIFVPYAKRRRDLVTAWNLFLLGSANFVGFAAVQTGRALKHYLQYDDIDYIRFVVGAILFYVLVFLVYYAFPVPKRMAARLLRKWPSSSNASLVFLLPVCVALGFLAIFTPNIQGIGQFLVIAGTAGAIIGVAFATVIWARQPANAAMAILVAAMVVFAVFVAIFGTTGRRSLLSVALCFPITWYWLHFRYTGTVTTAVKAAVLGLVVFVLIAAYSGIRGYRAPGKDAFADAVERLQMIPSAMLGVTSDENRDPVLGGDAVDCSLAAIHKYTNWSDPEPFHSVLFVLSNPVPRAFWEDKPEGLGYTLPRDVGVWKRTGFVNWGPGIVGHGYHEGGLLMLVFYALLIGTAIRFLDELLVRQPGNPYVLALFASISGQIVAFSRGDIGLFTVLIAGAVFSLLAIAWITRLFFGVGLEYLPEGQSLPEQPASAF